MEAQYLALLRRLMEEGDRRETRNGVTYSLFGEKLVCDMRDGFPAMTTKKLFWKGVVAELLMFVRGETDTKKLEEKGVNIWRGNTSREFLDKLGKSGEWKEGEMGKMYGYQWRNFNSQGIDQLKQLISDIVKDPSSRRLLLTTYNPAQAHDGVLYPCHGIVTQFYVRDDTLDMQTYQRSADFFLGVPFNIASYALLLHIIAALTGYKAGRLITVFGDLHLYRDHLNAATTQLSRDPHPLPSLQLPPLSSLEDVERCDPSDFQLRHYKYHPAIKAPMRA